MARKQFNNIDIFAGIEAKNGQQWQKENGITANWKTPEQIDIQPVYTKEDLEGMEHLDFAAGIPSARGPSASMPDSLPLRRVTHSTAATWPADRRDCP